MDVSGQYNAPAALTPGKNASTHGIDEYVCMCLCVCVGPQRDNSLELSGMRTPDRAVRSLVTTLSQRLKFYIKKTLRNTRDNSSRVRLKGITIIACCVVIIFLAPELFFFNFSTPCI